MDSVVRCGPARSGRVWRQRAGDRAPPAQCPARNRALQRPTRFHFRHELPCGVPLVRHGPGWHHRSLRFHHGGSSVGAQSRRRHAWGWGSDPGRGPGSFPGRPALDGNTEHGLHLRHPGGHAAPAPARPGRARGRCPQRRLRALAHLLRPGGGQRRRGGPDARLPDLQFQEHRPCRALAAPRRGRTGIPGPASDRFPLGRRGSPRQLHEHSPRGVALGRPAFDPGSVATGDEFHQLPRFAVFLANALPMEPLAALGRGRQPRQAHGRLRTFPHRRRPWSGLLRLHRAGPGRSWCRHSGVRLAHTREEQHCSRPRQRQCRTTPSHTRRVLGHTVFRRRLPPDPCRCRRRSAAALPLGG